MNGAQPKRSAVLASRLMTGGCLAACRGFGNGAPTPITLEGRKLPHGMMMGELITKNLAGRQLVDLYVPDQICRDVKMTEGLKTRAHRRKSNKAQMTDDLVALFMAQQLDLTEDYVRRSRAHRDLTAADLTEAWKGAYGAYARDPASDPLKAAMIEYQAELDLRGMAVPFEAVQQDMKKLQTLVVALTATDPVRVAEIGRNLGPEIAAFKARRDRSKN